ncbi:alpha/beta hydrolase [Solicola sp. PLA-1-18]|uniref:alpha/beta hydrolase n=1 Tax=Solicola sp. PLA-1-18 TaxID=3380532 RepID=UPI003B7C7F0E
MPARERTDGPPAARLVSTRSPRSPEAVALVLHGGASRPDRTVVSATQPSVLRMVPVALRLARAGRGRLAVVRLLNSARGWDSHRTPVDDVDWALEEVRREHGDLPVALVGHSLGGRAALLAGAREPVRTVVAMAPWLYDSDADVDLSGRRVLFVHGDGDRIASPATAARVATRLRPRADVGFVGVRGGKHAMLGRAGTFDGLAAEFVAATLLGDRPGPVVRRVLDGEPTVVV